MGRQIKFHRKFDGRRYELVSVTPEPTKASAQKIAEKYRIAGYGVRVVHVKGGYRVYVTGFILKYQAFF